MKNGAEIKPSSKDVLNSCNLLLKSQLSISMEKLINLKERTILIGMMNPSKNKDQIDEINKKRLISFH